MFDQHHNVLEQHILAKYSHTKNLLEARVDAVVLAAGTLACLLIDSSVPNANPDDVDANRGKINLLNEVLLDTRAGRWDTMKLFLQREAQRNLGEARFRANEFSDSNNEAIAEATENEGMRWANLARSI